LLINDTHDVATDRRNPRKASSPLVQGVVSAGWACRTAHLIAALALVGASLVSTTFLVLVATCLVLAWAYSVPPVRLKSLPGGDVLVNAVAIGVYAPTTIVDRKPDLAAGDRTIATQMGAENAYRVGWWAWVAANAGAIVLAGLDRVIPRGFLPVLLVFVPLLLWQYRTFASPDRDPEALVRGIVLCSLTFAAVNLLFALAYTGWLRL